LLHAAGDDTGVESTYRKATELAKCRGALGDMLRPVTQLARMKYASGEPGAASSVVDNVYYQIEEGFETRRMQETRELLEVIATAPSGSTSPA
jgi:hypothetical protein